MNAPNALQAQGPIPGPGDLVSGGLEVFKPNAVAMIVSMLIVGVVGAIPLIGLASIVLMPGLIVMAALRAASGKSVEIGHIAAAFKRLVPILLTSLVCGVIIGLGSAILVIPGLVAAIFLQYSMELCIDREMEFMDAIKASVDIVKGDIVGHAILALVVGVVAGIGSIAFGIGALVTMPLAMCMHAVAYHKQFGIQGGADKLVEA